VRKATPIIERVSAVLDIVAGLGITYYWLSVGGLGGQIRGWF
jgi:hypothetical protein